MDNSVVKGYKELGTLRFRSSMEIDASRISVGFETLDRKLFTPEQCYGKIAEAGVKWARCQTGWSRCEKEKGVYDFAWLDEVVDSLLSKGIRPWFNVGFGNALYMPDAPHASAVGCVPLYYPKETQDAWLRFLRELAARFKGRVSHFEIWNEPNADCFWRPGWPSPEDYAAFAGICSNELRAVIPDATIIACVAGCPADYVLRTLKAGIGRHIDRYALHPYGNIPEINYEQAVAALRSMIAKHAPHVRLWQGECGCPSQSAGHHDDWLALFNMDHAKQAKWLLRRLLTDLWLDFELISYFHAADLMEGDYVQANGQKRLPVMMGLLNGRSYTKKISFYSLAGLCSVFDAAAKPENLFMNSCIGFGRFESKLQEISLRKMSFVRKGLPIYAYYQPEDVQLETPARRGLTLHLVDDAPEPLKRPVLLDLLQLKLFEIPDVKREGAGFLVLRDLPVTDYPLIVCDASMIDSI